MYGRRSVFERRLAKRSTRRKLETGSTLISVPYETTSPREEKEEERKKKEGEEIIRLEESTIERGAVFKYARVFAWRLFLKSTTFIGSQRERREIKLTYMLESFLHDSYSYEIQGGAIDIFYCLAVYRYVEKCLLRRNLLIVKRVPLATDCGP